MYPGLGQAVLLKPHSCPLKCGATIPGKLLEQHVHRECPQRSALCPEGCGEVLPGWQLEGHRAECPMRKLLDRTEVAIRESSMREFRLALDGVYQQREVALARMRARGAEEACVKGWASGRCAVRVSRVETDSRDLVTRSRRRAKERLTAALAFSGTAGASASGTTTGGPVNAMRYWDALEAPQDEVARGCRPWDLQAPGLQVLVDALDEAAVCGSDEQLRRRGELALLGTLRRVLGAALEVVQGRRTMLADALQRANEALRFVELEDTNSLADILQQAQEEERKAALVALPGSVPEFYQAIAHGDVELCAWLLDRERANPSLPHPSSGLPPLVVAAKASDLPMCQLLLARRAEVDGCAAADRCTALHWAANQRAHRVASLLLAGHANPRLQDRRGQDALMKLVRRDFLGPPTGCAWSWEVQPGRRLPGPRLPGSGTMDLEGAKVAGEADEACVGFSFRSAGAGTAPAGRVRVLLRAAPAEEGRGGARRLRPPPPPEASGGDGTATAAITEESAEATLERLEETEDESLWTSYLKVATDPAHDVRALLAAGANVGAADSGGLTALHHHLRSAPHRGSPAVVAALLRASADVNHRDGTEHAATPLLLAVEARRPDLLRLFVSEAFPPADVDARTADGTSALALAEALGTREAADVLRKAGASAWCAAEVRLGSRTTFSFDTRVPPAPA